ncbi:hypothetical protein M406DRAFT_95328 [Cryphonectria parasitica EP155]|uniref:Exonuclease 1 n=1 Tax=Cryphonectria parasitica (strain ATCC 38755 / EP155) TaxID=660469 RepID=A0A9P4XYR3_CRYP1|nr:uncharacterized protein M406DRAFT_95328 [Cryphonectria parasitica EP155]KAF3763779.1 hypothetical protein M406DRAFT_95328 [Cryphonectria parasitica EP155]
MLRSDTFIDAVSGLLPLLKSIQRPTEIKKFSGEVLGVDAYGWLHRGAVGCAIDLAQDKPTRKYVDFAMHRVRMVKHFGVTPYLVFDGDFLPSKARTESSRSKRREDSRKAGLALLNAGKPAQAHLELQKAIDVTPEMARHLIEELKKEGVPYVVAPYEADAQLVYLERQGLINGIISEDSDLLVFGAKRLLTKMDQHGQCVEINRRDFCAVREISLTGWTDDQFRQMAIFSGCDYLESVGNMGLKTAYRMMRKYKTPERVIRMLQFDGKFRVSENYLAQYKQAELTFLYQRVFCPRKQQLVLLTEPHATSPLDIEEMPYIGARVDAETAKAVANGDVNPITKQTIVVAALPPKRRTETPTTGRTVAVAAPGQGRAPPEKSIDSYFSGHRRIPMGEMDRNCFSVDPQRVAALTQNGLTPRVFPLPRPYVDDGDISPAPRPYTDSTIHRRRTEPISRTQSDSDPAVRSSASRRRTTGLTRRISDIEARPPKKPRLCADDSANETTETPAERSKFFPRDGEALRRCDENLMSDDSIEEALADLPDIGDQWKGSRASETRQTLQIFQDETSTEQTTTTAASEPETKDDETFEGSPAAQGQEYGVVGESESQAGDVEINLGRKSLRNSLQEFSYTPSMSRRAGGVRIVHGLPTPDSSGQQAQTTSLPTPTQTPFQTPLQRIGAAALQRSKAGCSPSARSGPSSLKATKKRASLADSLENFPINPSFVPLPKVDLKEVEALNTAGVGSEDQMFPGSDEENEPPATTAGIKQGSARRLDLSKFVCG